MVFIWGDRGYPALRFEYKMAFEQYLVAKHFWVYLEKNEIVIFRENTQNCFAYISVAKYCSKAILY